MHIVEVVPISSLPKNAPQMLSYFCPSELPKGAIVEVPIARRKIKAVVIASAPIEEEKMNLKKSAFQIKNISKIISPEPLISNMQFRIALWISKNYFAPLSMAIKTVLPPFFLKRGYTNFSFPEPQKKPVKPFYLACPAKKSLDAIEETIRETIKNGGQVLIVVPEISIIKNYAAYFSKNNDPTIIYGGLGNKELYKNWRQTSDKATLIIGSRQSLFAPYKNLKMIIVDDPHHEAFKSDMTPLYRTPELARAVAEMTGADLIFISPLPNVVSYYHIKNREYFFKDLAPQSRTQIEVIDTNEEFKTGNFSIFSRKLIQELEIAKNNNNSILIFSSRKGYASVLVCENCRLTAKCPQCSVPLRVYKTPETYLLCHHCLKKIKMPEICSNCSSYKLKAIGTPGTQKIAEELRKYFDEKKIVILDASIVKDNSPEEDILVKKMAEKGVVVVASQMIFSHRHILKFDLIGIPGADSLMSLPEYQSEEKMLYQLYKLLDFKPETLIIQTYNPKNKTLSAFLQQDFASLYREELEIRESFSYPPFSKIAKITFGHPNAGKAAAESRILSEKMKMVISQLDLKNKVQILGPSPAFFAREKNIYYYNIILKIEPEENLDKILKYVPADWRIDIDPNEIL